MRKILLTVVLAPFGVKGFVDVWWGLIEVNRWLFQDKVVEDAKIATAILVGGLLCFSWAFIYMIWED